jgi:hypothetical protein
MTFKRRIASYRQPIYVAAGAARLRLTKTLQSFAISLTVIAAYSDTDGRRLDENREIDLVFAARSRRI